MTEDRAPYAVPLQNEGLTRAEYLACATLEDVEAAIQHKTAERVRSRLFGTTKPPLVAVTCPQCGAVLARVSAGASVEVKCLRCKSWISKDAA